MLYFDPNKLNELALECGLLSFANEIHQLSTKNAFDKVVDTIDGIETIRLTPNLHKGRELLFPEKQLEFFSNKRLLLIDKMKSERFISKKPHSQSKNEKFSITEYALFIYFLQKGKDRPYFENHPEGKLKAIEELINKEGLNASPKYFQTKYNEFSNYESNIKNLRNRKIKATVLEMLKGYPRSHKVAKELFNDNID